MAVDLVKQREQFAKLKDDFARLNAKFADATKALGLKEDELEMDPAEIPPEAVKAMETAKVEAEKAGRNAAAALEAESSAQSCCRQKRPRRGAIAV